MLVYLDSSAIVKRYIEESGSESLDAFYRNTELDDESKLIFSSWNIGEVIGAIDTRFRRGDLNEKSMRNALKLFSGETRKFVAMRKMALTPISNRILTQGRKLILKHHIYQADALQIASAIQAKADLFVSADRKLIEYARSEKLDALNPEKDGVVVKTYYE